MAKLFFVCSLMLCQLLCSASINGQNPANWQQGVIVFSDSTILVGSVNLNFEHNIVLFHSDVIRRSIPAWQILKVDMHDTKIGCIRNFIVVKNRESGHAFYEIITNGKIQILVRDRIPGNYNHFTSQPKSDEFYDELREFVERKDFFLYDGKSLIPISKFRKWALPAFSKYYGPELEEFIKYEKLNINLLHDQIRIVKFFNKLCAGDGVLVKR